MRCNMSGSCGPWLIATAITAITGCQQAVHTPQSQPVTDNVFYTITMDYNDGLYRFLGIEDGDWTWNWQLTCNSSPRRAGLGRLTLKGRRAIWRLSSLEPEPPTTLPDSGRLLLLPDEPQEWHSLTLTCPFATTTSWLPLPRQHLQSAYYADLLDFLQAMTTPHFEQRVAHWPDGPIPVRAPATAISGAIDLTECLAEAVDLWNCTAADSLFRWDPGASWGVRLIHLPDGQLHPPMACQIVRLDGHGQPLVLHILAGNAYDTERVRPHAVRALAHELGHVLLLWGHSDDRWHLLWRSGPIVDGPSPDEIHAARFLSLLPLGLDLSAYGRSAELDPEW